MCYCIDLRRFCKQERRRCRWCDIVGVDDAIINICQKKQKKTSSVRLYLESVKFMTLLIELQVTLREEVLQVIDDAR